MARLTLDRMAAGGMYDLLGGGFHRYSVDAHWLVPHFEKMLYDNALLASAYLHAWAVTADERYRRVTTETLDYVLRELRLPEGGLASAQDADTNGVEGLTFTWTHEELESVLGEPHPEWLRPFEDGRFVLRGDLPEESRATLLAERERRPQPLRDDKALAAWNGLALAALAQAGARLGRPDYVEAGVAVAEFLLAPLSDERGRLLRSFRAGDARIPGYLEDYANVANGLLELSWATGDLRWLEEARRLAGLLVELFADRERGGFYVDAPEGEGLVARRKEFDDHPTPAGNSMAAFVLLRLARIYGDVELEKQAVGVFRLAHPLLERAPAAVSHLLCALDLHFSAPQEIAVVGDSPELRRAAQEGFRPNAVYAFSPEPTDDVPLLAGRGPGRRPPGRIRLRALRVPASGDDRPRARRAPGLGADEDRGAQRHRAQQVAHVGVAGPRAAGRRGRADRGGVVRPVHRDPVAALPARQAGRAGGPKGRGCSSRRPSCTGSRQSLSVTAKRPIGVGELGRPTATVTRRRTRWPRRTTGGAPRGRSSRGRGYATSRTRSPRGRPSRGGRWGAAS